MSAEHAQSPRGVNVDNNAAYPLHLKILKKKEEKLSDTGEIRQVKYLNNIIEQVHRGVKRLTNSGSGFYSFQTTSDAIAGIEVMHMAKKADHQYEFSYFKS